MRQILERRRNSVNGFGLPVKTEVTETTLGNPLGLFEIESKQTNGPSEIHTS
jgi:hypothetical protein